MLNTYTLLGLCMLCVLLVSATSASAGCSITIKVKNNEANTIKVDWYLSQVRIKSGTWKRIAKFGRPDIAPGQTISKVYSADFGCNKNRRYKLRFYQGTDSWMEYFPSQNAWTKNATILVNAKR